MTRGAHARPRRWCRRCLILVAVGLVLLTVLLVVGHAAAQQPPPATTTTSTTTDTTTTTTASAVAEDDPSLLIPDVPYQGGLTHPASHYDLGWSSGTGAEIGIGPFHQQVSPAFSPIGLMMSGAYSVSNAEVQIACRVTSWALNFGDTITNILADPVDVIGKALSFTIIGGLQLRWLVLALAGIAILRTATRGDLGAAGGQALSTFLILLAAGAAMLNPGGLYRQSVDIGRSFSALVMDATANRTPQPGEKLGDAYFGALQRTLVAQPYEKLNWGGPQSGKCAATVDGILRDAPNGGWGDSDEPRKRMIAAGCNKAATFNASASFGRLWGAVALGLITFTVAVGMIVFALLMLIAMIGLSLTWAVAPVALTLGAAPQFRGIAASWTAGLAGRILKLPLLAGITGGFLTAVGSIAAAPESGPNGISMAGRWLMLILFVGAFAVMLWKARKIEDVVRQTLRGYQTNKPLGRVVLDSRDAAQSARYRMTRARTAAQRPVSRTGRVIRSTGPVRRVEGSATGLFTRVIAGRP